LCCKRIPTDRCTSRNLGTKCLHLIPNSITRRYDSKCHIFSGRYYANRGTKYILQTTLYSHFCERTEKFYVLPTQVYLYFLCGSENKQRLFSYTALTGFYNRDLTLQSPVVTICTASLTFNNSTLCPTLYLCFLCGSEKKQRLFPYTALTNRFL